MVRSLPCKELDCAFQGEGGASSEDPVVGTRLLALRIRKICMAKVRRGLEKSGIHMVS